MKLPETDDVISHMIQKGTAPTQRGKDAGDKFDAGKLMYDLTPWRAVRGVVTVLTYGAKKYGAHNWEKGIKVSRLFAAAMRHLTAFWLGEDTDTESGLPHIDHAICDLMMMREMFSLHPEMDDRTSLKGKVDFIKVDDPTKILFVDPAYTPKEAKLE